MFPNVPVCFLDFSIAFWGFLWYNIHWKQESDPTMSRKVKQCSIRDIAREAGASVSSVSRVLNNHSDVSESLRKRIQEVIDRSGFVPDRAERAIRINVIIGVGDITDYISSILTGIYWEAERLNIEISIQRCCSDRISLLRCCRIWHSDAVILISAVHLYPQVESLCNADIPCLLLDGQFNCKQAGYIYMETVFGTNQLLRLLENNGHRDIAMLAADPFEMEIHQTRYRIYCEYMRAFNKEPILIPMYPLTHIDGIGRAKEAGSQPTLQLQEHPEVTAVICLNDEIAMGCYKACFDCGKRIPEDISVVGFGDESFAKYMTPGLTTSKSPLTQSGRLAVQYLQEYIAGVIDRLPQVDLPSELVIRGSVAPIKIK